MARRSTNYPQELRERRAVRMVAQVRPEYQSDWPAICAVAEKLGIGTAETLRKWVRQAEVDADQRPGVTSEESAENRRLKRRSPSCAGRMFSELGHSWLSGRDGHCVFGLSLRRYRGESEVGELVVAAAVDLGEFVVGAGEADLEPFDLAEPAFAFGLGDAGGEVVADLGDAGPLGRVGPEHGASEQACSWTQGVANARPLFPTGSLRRSKWPRNSSRSWSVGVRYSSVGRSARRRAMNA